MTDLSSEEGRSKAIDSLLRSADDDWISLADVLDVGASTSGAGAPPANEVLSVVRDLLDHKLAVAGQLGEAGFERWSGSNADHLARIDETLRAAQRDRSRLHDCWFSLSALARELVHAGRSARNATTFDAGHPAVVELRRASPALARADDAVIDAWRPEPPPLLLRLAAMGRAVASVPVGDDDERRAVLEAVEAGMQGPASDEMAMGFLEAVVSEWDLGTFDLATYWNELGPESRGYVRAWVERTGGTRLPDDSPPT